MTTDSSPRPILLDTDIGSDVDDALALAMILASPEAISLEAVTTVCGDTRIRARIAAGLLEIAGRTEIDVCAGESAPILREPGRFVWFGHEESCVPEGTKARVSDEGAAERIVRAAREIPGLEVVLIGPMTNLARALALDPELPQRVGGITIMGGHIREVQIGDFSCPPGVDYNLCSDPDSSVAVLGAGFPTTLVTADVTLRTWMNSRDLADLALAEPLGPVLAEQVKIWSPVQRRIFSAMGGTLADDNEGFLHDPLTVLALIEPELLDFEELRIIPTIEGGVMRTLESSHGGAAMRVATHVDAKAAARAIVSRLTA